NLWQRILATSNFAQALKLVIAAHIYAVAHKIKKSSPFPLSYPADHHRFFDDVQEKLVCIIGVALVARVNQVNNIMNDKADLVAVYYDEVGIVSNDEICDIYLQAPGF